MATDLKPALNQPESFQFDQVPSIGRPTVVPSPLPPVDPIAAFSGTYSGRGFNTIFRPNLGSPTQLPTPPIGPPDNVLELNLTKETLSFTAPLGNVPNRGEVQPDIFLNGVHYLQSITDVTVPTDVVAIHSEPGLWMVVPATSQPTEGVTVVRMGSIPHGTTINAQGTATTTPGPPQIPAVSITPPGAPPFPSQTVAAEDTWRIPQNLSALNAAGTITQAILDDPNTVLRQALAGQTITQTTTISISTDPANPLFGGGVGNIAFLLGDAAAVRPNAQTVEMTATFWIETVQHVITVPPFTPGRPPLQIPSQPAPSSLTTTFLVNPPIPITPARQIIVTSTQIQYSQKVMLKFNTLQWPHVSVATLVPTAPVPIPPSVWAQLGANS